MSEKPIIISNWFPEELTDVCATCSSQFWFLSKKIHCRKCGLIHCATCTGNYLPLKERGYQEPARVCEKCFKNYKELSNQQLTEHAQLYSQLHQHQITLQNSIIELFSSPSNLTSSSPVKKKILTTIESISFLVQNPSKESSVNSPNLLKRIETLERENENLRTSVTSSDRQLHIQTQKVQDCEALIQNYENQIKNYKALLQQKQHQSATQIEDYKSNIQTSKNHLTENGDPDDRPSFEVDDLSNLLQNHVYKQNETSGLSDLSKDLDFTNGNEDLSSLLSEVNQNHNQNQSIQDSLKELMSGFDGDLSFKNQDGGHDGDQDHIPLYKLNQQFDQNKLIYGYGVKGDMNKSGLQKAKKKTVLKNSKARFQMEDENLCCFPFQERENLALFAIFDGHVDKNASAAAKDRAPHILQSILDRKYTDLSTINITLWEDFYNQLDSQLKEFEYEGTTATTALIWTVNSEKFLQVANVGDSSAFLRRGEEVIELTQDHRVSNPSEQKRLRDSGQELISGQTRLNGLSVSRALGDHFMKENETGFIGIPHVSPVIKLTPRDTFLIMASDGLWDVISAEEAMSLISNLSDPQEMSKHLVSSAVKRTGCNDNVTAIVVCL